MQNKNIQSRKFQLTINNPKENNFTHDRIRETVEKKFSTIRYYCMADEIGNETQTYHTHIFMQFSTPVRFSQLKRHFHTAHIEKSIGTAQQNRDYILKIGRYSNTEKSETNLKETHFEWGHMKKDKQGKRSDMDTLYSYIKKGLTNFEIFEKNPSFMRHINTINRVRKEILQEKYREKFRKLKICYIFGETGVGKTRSVMEYFGYRNVFRVTDYKHPFDSYNQEDVIVFDEFDSQLRIQQMLNFLDGYPISLPNRYYNKWATFTKVFIISNLNFSEQYEYERKHRYDLWKPFLRRFDAIFEMVDSNDIHLYNYLIKPDDSIDLKISKRYSFKKIASQMNFDDSKTD